MSIEIIDTTIGDLKPMDWVLTGKSKDFSDNDKWRQIFWVTPPSEDLGGRVALLFGDGKGAACDPPEGVSVAPDTPCHAVMAEQLGHGENFFTLLSQMPYKGDTKH